MKSNYVEGRNYISVDGRTFLFFDGTIKHLLRDGWFCVSVNCTVMWANHDHFFHRTDGPAVLRNMSIEWCMNGKFHRTDGPAVIYVGGAFEWHVNGEDITKEVNEWMDKNDISYPFTNEEQMLFEIMFG